MRAEPLFQRLCPQNSERSHFPQPGCAAFPAAPHCAKTMALSFCLRDTAAFPAALHLRHPLLRASPECRAMLPRTSFQFFLCAQLCAIERLYHILPPCASSFFHLMPHAPPECKAERPEPACGVGAFSADVRGFQLPPYCLRQQGPTLGSSAGETPAPQAKNTTAPGRRGIGSGRRGRQCLYQGREMA